MAERRMPKIVRQRDCFGEIFIECQRPRDCPADRCDFNRMCQPGSEMVAGAVQKNLCLVFEPPKCARMNDPCAVALKLSPIGVAWLRIFSAARVARFLRERREHSAFGRLHLLSRSPTFVHQPVIPGCRPCSATPKPWRRRVASISSRVFQAFFIWRLIF